MNDSATESEFRYRAAAAVAGAWVSSSSGRAHACDTESRHASRTAGNADYEATRELALHTTTKRPPPPKYCLRSSPLRRTAGPPCDSILISIYDMKIAGAHRCPPVHAGAVPTGEGCLDLSDSFTRLPLYAASRCCFADSHRYARSAGRPLEHIYTIYSLAHCRCGTVDCGKKSTQRPLSSSAFVFRYVLASL